VDRVKYEAANQLYREKNYRKAARLFLEAADKGTPLENGMAYHGAGNCFMRLARYHDAIVVFEQALRDDSYQKRGAVENSLGNAYLKHGDLSQALAHFEAALGEASTKEHYRSHQGLAQVYFKQRAFEQAALANKNAALDEGNPNPGAALVNLGLCLMALGQPKSAAEAYQAALGVEGYTNRGKALANLGMASYAQGELAAAKRALEEAQVMRHYPLSQAAIDALADCQTKLEQGIEREEPVTQAQQPMPGDPAVPGSADGASADPEDLPDGSTGQIGNLDEVDNFFALTDKEIVQQGKEELRRSRGLLRRLRPLLIIVVVLLVLGGAVAYTVLTGFGIPSRTTTLDALISAYNTGGSFGSYWTDDASEINRQMSALPLPTHYTIDSFETGPLTSTAKVSVRSGTGAKSGFRITFERVNTGWKVSAISGGY